MLTSELDLQELAGLLGRRCPYVLFATLNDLNDAAITGHQGHATLAVFLTPGTRRWKALEQILSITSELDLSMFEVIILNHADIVTRYRAARGICLLTGEERVKQLQLFAWRARLDYRVFRAHQRRNGLTDTE